MNIEQAIKRIEWRFKNSWNINEKDVEAFNSILDYKDIQESVNLQKNESLAKLWIYTLMSLNRTNMYSAERSIQVIDEILDKSVYQHCKDLHNNIKMLNWNAVFEQYPEYIQAVDGNRLKTRNEIAKRILEEREDDLWESITKDISEDNIIKFVEKQVSRILLKYEK